MDNLKETVEALIFASGIPLSKKYIVEKIPSLTTRELNFIVEELKEKYSGDSGIVLATFNDKMQFLSNAKYGDMLAEVLTPIKEKELSRSLLEALAIIAYKQPITRGEVEDIKGSGAEYHVAMLEKAGLIAVIGRKNTVGRPLLYGTTEEFLKRFQLENISDLPSYKQVLERIVVLSNFTERRETLFSDRSINDQPDEIIVEPTVKIPEILLRENTNIVASDLDEEEKVLDADIFFDGDDDDDMFGDGEKYETYD